jgi:phage terminase large subunit-like protein
MKTNSPRTDTGHARDFAEIALGYAAEAADGANARRFCKWIRLAAERHLNDLARSESDPSWPYEFDAWWGNDVCDFIEKLPHVEGEWDTPTITLEPPQIFILVVIFGWRRRSDGLRRFTSVYIEMARKGAKSTLTAGVALYCLACEGETGPQVVIGATTGEQAGKVFKPAKAMVDKTPDLQEAFGLQAWSRSITCAENGGYIQPINAKGKTQDGWNPYLGVMDELHAHKDRALYDVIKSAFGARKAPLMWVITTAGYNMAGVCYEQRALVCRILDGALAAEHYFGIIFTLDEGDDPYDPETWVKANPMLGVTPTLQSMEAYAAEAMASPASEGEFKTKRLNLWLGAASAWLNMAQWRACDDPGLGWDSFDGLDCYVGADLADKDDICAVVLAGLRPDGMLLIKPVFFLPEAVLKTTKDAEGTSGVAPYRAWAKSGHLVITEGDWIDHDEVEFLVRIWIARYGARKVTFDQFAAAQAMASRLNEDLGSPDDPLAAILHKSAPNVTDPARELEARVKAGLLRHDGNPVLTWMAANTVVSRRVDGSIIPKKETPGSAMKIDGIDAAINAIAPWVMGERREASYFETLDPEEWA